MGTTNLLWEDFSVAKTKKSTAEVTVNRRSAKDRRSETDRRKKSEPVKVERRKIERREKVNRRRQIDPTTCERDYTPEEIEFMQALDDYKRASGRMFPTCSEVLEVVRNLGYVKLPEGRPEMACTCSSAEPNEASEEADAEETDLG